MTTEIWKDIPKYEGTYQASNLGRIRTHKDKTTYTKKHGVRKWKQRVLKPKSKFNKAGYRVTLWKDGKYKDFLVARLVATTFLKNMIDTKMTVNHKDGNRFNNNIDNLEWVTIGDNIRHAFDTGLMPYKKIEITNIETNDKLVFRSMATASNYMGYNKGYISNKIKKGIDRNEKWKWKVLGGKYES